MMRHFVASCAFTGLAIFGSWGLAGQSSGDGSSGARTILPVEQEISLARSAAPSSVTDEATILALGPEGYRKVVSGTNGVTCIVARTWIESLEPFCFDEEASKTVFPVERYRVERYHQGATREEVEREVADKLQDGTFRPPTRPAMTYMMSSAQVLYSDAGHRVGAWNPHLMIYFPYLTQESIGLPHAPGSEGLVVVNPGTPWSNIMVIVKDFVDPIPPKISP